MTNNERVDSTIGDIHKTRERISDEFGGDIRAITKDARMRQEQSGRRTVAFAESPHKSVEQTGGVASDNEGLPADPSTFAPQLKSGSN